LRRIKRGWIAGSALSIKGWWLESRTQEAVGREFPNIVLRKGKPISGGLPGTETFHVKSLGVIAA